MVLRDYPEIECGIDVIPYDDLKAKSRWNKPIQIPGDFIPTLSGIMVPTDSDPNHPRMLYGPGDGSIYVTVKNQVSGGGTGTATEQDTGSLGGANVAGPGTGTVWDFGPVNVPQYLYLINTGFVCTPPYTAAGDSGLMEVTLRCDAGNGHVVRAGMLAVAYGPNGSGGSMGDKCSYEFNPPLDCFGTWGATAANLHIVISGTYPANGRVAIGYNRSLN